ncbi:MAG: hypothetical protein Ta2E_12160 [Mycoplasmoidaceae bacterium]|nr:MAG: hypothetical protein Ta2E_12160 [Mycoplasmoidaceae bacterium]
MNSFTKELDMWNRYNKILNKSIRIEFPMLFEPGHRGRRKSGKNWRKIPCSSNASGTDETDGIRVPEKYGCCSVQCNNDRKQLGWSKLLSDRISFVFDSISEKLFRFVRIVGPTFPWKNPLLE